MKNLFTIATALFVCSFTQARILWKEKPQTEGKIETTISLHSDSQESAVIATGSSDFNLFKIDVITGNVIWKTYPQFARTRGSSWGDENLILGPDMNGDGHRDLLWGTARGSDMVYAIDSQTGDVIWFFDTHKNPESQFSGAIQDIAATHDYDGDGVNDILFGVGLKDRRAYLVNGRTGKFMWMTTFFFDTPTEVLSVDDINGDRVPDAVVATSGGDGRLMAFSGKDFFEADVIWSRDLRATIISIETVSDVDGDGHSDIVTADWKGYITLVSGKTGAIIWKSFTDMMNMRILISDVNGDGISDVVSQGHSTNVFAFNGKNGEAIWKKAIPTSDAVWAGDITDDRDADGVADIIVGDFSGHVTLISGADGKILKSFFVGPSKISTVRATSDIDHDLRRDFIVGMMDQSDDPSAGAFYAISL